MDGTGETALDVILAGLEGESVSPEELVSSFVGNVAANAIIGLVGKAISNIAGAKVGDAVNEVGDMSITPKVIVKTNLGNDIDITPTANHSTVIKKAPIQHLPNSSIDILDEATGEIRTRRYYDSKGNVFRDVDMDNHGNSRLHPEYPHEHNWSTNSNGQLRRRK
ncbi:hypothetical protein [Streptococcus acidominimus]|uniref:Uncharacterized protein n=1 Tax=Streptococcus acidominimus TaxID=1326 RepID=A0A4Y9FPV7_STRAI|nr:hypothetical protein [Streptococcus acidominimus]MBF0819110.1 hypothetical protein [Streptococcus acidominimus]MBF0839740.1 hypothetical protein [Streptococcus acidominimus]TFU30339.1 hypothetical protein E4U01_06620 [Streptococcus acidominimus]